MPEFKGRPGSAGQRPTGGDKAVATQKKAYFRRKKVCRFCVEKIDDINYKDMKLLHSFVAERGKIVPRRISGVCAPHQRRLTDAIKKARNIALLPFAAQLAEPNHGSHTARRYRTTGQPRPGSESGRRLRPQFSIAQTPRRGRHGRQPQNRGAGAPVASAPRSQTEGRSRGSLEAARRSDRDHRPEGR